MVSPARLLLSHQDDRRLAALAGAGHEPAFEAIVRRHHGALLRHSARIVGADRAEDVLQQALLNAYRALLRGDEVADLAPWLHRVVHNAALSALRSHPQAASELDGAEATVLAAESAEDAVARRERLRETVASVRDLPDRQREALLLQAAEGRSYDEIAAHLGLTDGAVRQLLNRARGRLRAGVTVLTPIDLLLRLGGTEAQAAAAVLAAGGAGGAGLLAKGAVVAAGVAALGGAATVVSAAPDVRPAAPATTPVASAGSPTAAARVSDTAAGARVVLRGEHPVHDQDDRRAPALPAGSETPQGTPSPRTSPAAPVPGARADRPVTAVDPRRDEPRRVQEDDDEDEDAPEQPDSQVADDSGDRDGQQGDGGDDGPDRPEPAEPQDVEDADDDVQEGPEQSDADEDERRPATAGSPDPSQPGDDDDPSTD